MMSRSVRAETRQRAKDEKKHHISNLFAARKWQVLKNHKQIYAFVDSEEKN